MGLTFLTDRMLICVQWLPPSPSSRLVLETKQLAARVTRM
jgi:hypothetical protein